MDVILTLANGVENINTPLWKVSVDGKPFPCEAMSVMDYDKAVEMIGLATDLAGTVED